jgi:AraC-like DNA-binding protein
LAHSRFKKNGWASQKEEQMKQGRGSVAPQERKGFSVALSQFLGREVPSLRGQLIRDQIVKEICKLIDEYYPSTEHMKMGQILWYAVDVNEKAGYGKRLEDCQMRPVVLDLIHQSDIDDYLDGIVKRERQKKITVRLFKQAYDQSGVMTIADISTIMRLSPNTISKYIKEYQNENHTVVPHRGTIHDLGRTLTHKKIICEKHLKEGKSIEQTARETYHSPQAVARYVNDFNRVRECLKAGWKSDKISYATGLSESLTKEYVDLMVGDELPF